MEPPDLRQDLALADNEGVEAGGDPHEVLGGVRIGHGVRCLEDRSVVDLLLERDIMLMFANCVMFNKSTTPIVDMAREMKNEVSETFKMFEEAEMNLNQ